jgi:uncharacterized protein YmfQ (DUF2313 family)
MPATLSDRALDLLGDLPPYERDDPAIQAIIAAVADEIAVLEATANEILQGLFPQNADDTYGTLSYYERLLALPVAPPGQSLDQRRAMVLSYLATRKSASAADWVATLNRALGGAVWSYEEGPGDYQVTLHIPYEEGGYTVSQVLNLARAITPAHLDVLGSFNEGFLIGISEIGVSTL